MNRGNKLIKNIFLHIKYPYTALIIAVMWISMAIIIIHQKQNNFELLIAATAICTIIISISGFRSHK